VQFLHEQSTLCSAGENRCSVSTEPFEEDGPNQPVILPGCGHTFSRDTVAKLIEHRGLNPVKCPKCKKSQDIHDADQCNPNWDRIASLQNSSNHHLDLQALTSSFLNLLSNSTTGTALANESVPAAGSNGKVRLAQIQTLPKTHCGS
jgi:hypothetical protein